MFPEHTGPASWSSTRHDEGGSRHVSERDSVAVIVHPGAPHSRSGADPMLTRGAYPAPVPRIRVADHPLMYDKQADHD